MTLLGNGGWSPKQPFIKPFFLGTTLQQTYYWIIIWGYPRKEALAEQALWETKRQTPNLL